jgi:DNA (cytosine-5)-methyltransferase 1
MHDSDLIPDVLDLQLIPDFSHSYSFDGRNVVKTVSLRGRKLERAFPSRGIEKSDAMASWWRAYLDNFDQYRLPESSGVLEGEIRYIDLFSSVGGLSLGFEESVRSIGKRPIPILAADIDDGALAIHQHNHETSRVVHESVASLVDFKVIGQGSAAKFAFRPTVEGTKISDLIGKVDAVLAGPPCQGHSTLNNYSRGDDPRNLLYLTVPAIAVALNIPIVIIENVPNVLNDVDNVVESTKKLLLDNGYEITGAVLQAHHLGWAQTRKRYFLVATKGFMPVDLSTLSDYLAHDPLSTKWALSDVYVEGEMSPKHVMNSVSEMSAKNQERIDWLFDNDAYELPNHIRPVCHQDGHTYPSVYGRMSWEKPAPTLTTGYVSPGRGRFIHPLERRVLTPREAARLQGFPNWFNFTPFEENHSKRGQLAKWVGDAVPSILGYVSGLSALVGLESNNPNH